jgi:WD40 repeat protein
MNTQREPDLLIKAFLDDGVNELPDSSYDAVRSAIEQRRQRVVIGPWREQQMQRFAMSGIAAAVIVLAAVVGLRFLPSNTGIGVGGEPTASPTASLMVSGASPTASPSPAATSSPSGASSPPRSSADIGAIAYVTESGLGSLYLALPGREPLQLAPSRSGIGNEVACPSFSPDGTSLAVGMPAGDIVVMPINDEGVPGNGKRLDGRAAESVHCAAWAPDSSAVAFLDDSALVIVPLDGEPQRIEDWDIDVSGGESFMTDYPPDRAVQWSPGGSVIAVARPSGTWLIPTDGGTPRRLHETPAFSVSWSPDATELVVGARGPRAIVIQTADGMTLAELPTRYGPPVWSPVEDRIAFSAADAGLVVARPDGTDSVLVAEGGYHPTWSGDGRALIYIQDTASAAWRLMTADITGTGESMPVVDSIPISDPRSFPRAQQITWQPVQP